MISYPLVFLGGAVAGLVFLAYAELKLPKTGRLLDKALVYLQKLFDE